MVYPIQLWLIEAYYLLPSFGYFFVILLVLKNACLPPFTHKLTIKLNGKIIP